MPYMTIEVLALAYTWASGRQTIFHATEFSFGSSIAVHTIGHFIGGLTWEPLFVFVTMEVWWALYSAADPRLNPKQQREPECQSSQKPD